MTPDRMGGRTIWKSKPRSARYIDSTGKRHCFLVIGNSEAATD
jgi:hypothetical protein